MIDTSIRSSEKEIMDDLEMNDPILLSTLDQIAKINKRLGGNKVTTNGILELIKSRTNELDKPIRILDVGCGNGAVLRSIADKCQKEQILVELIGLDANQTTINYAIEQSKNYQNITFIQQDIFSNQIQDLEFDIATATLFLHHFTNKEIEKIIQNLMASSFLGIVINDLHRSQFAYVLFKFISLFISNKMVKNDGAISILRAFKRKDLVTFSQQLKLTSTIRWKWAFRFQWIIQK
jgi:2-polyprenyl-3-methyl-5-hydroxy-6-metoxy-1,4-benzoquinol methylase